MSYTGFYMNNYTRFFLNRLIGCDTIVKSTLLGVSIRLKIKTRRELRRVRKASAEALLLERTLTCLREGDTIYDVGANIGMISLFMAMSPAGGTSKVHCFEPEPRNAGQLRQNVELNGLAGRATVHEMALSAEAGEVTLFVQGSTGEGKHSIATDDGATGSITVPMVTMTDFAQSCGSPPDVVKIDVEGAEGLVLAGMADLVESGHPREILMEIHAKGDSNRMPNGDLIHDWLTDRGYSCVWEVERRSEQQCHYRLGPRGE